VARLVARTRRSGNIGVVAQVAATPMHEAISDEDLMHAWQLGDAAAFEALYRRYRGSLYRFLVRQAGEPDAGEELYHDVWMTLVRGRDRWIPAATLKTYLYRIAHSRLIDYYRARKPHSLDVSIDADGGPDLADTCVMSAADAAWKHNAAGDAVRRCLDALPPAQREAFLLKEESGLGLGDIATVTGAEPETIKSRVRYAIARLRKCLEGWL
jgi:RNA polymerase sigma-70 factor (ECF subfamily)